MQIQVFFFAYLLEENIRRVLQLRTAVSTTVVNKVNIFRDGGEGFKKNPALLSLFLTFFLPKSTVEIERAASN